MVFALKTAPLAPELKVSMGPSPHLWFCTVTTATLWPELIVSMSLIPYMSFFAFMTAPLAPDLQVSMGPSPHLWFCAFTTATLWPELIVSIGPRLHVFCIRNSVISTRITSLHGFQTSPVVFACKTATLGPELQVSMGLSPHLWFVHAKQRLLDQNYKSLWVPAIICSFVHAKLSDYHQKY